MTDISRRSFFRRAAVAIAGAAAAATVPEKLVQALELDPERALWVPGQKTIFLPPAKEVIKPGITRDTEWYTRESLKQLERKFTVTDDAGRFVYSGRYMVQDSGLHAPVTEEGFRKGFEIRRNLYEVTPDRDLRITVYTPETGEVFMDGPNPKKVRLSRFDDVPDLWRG